MGASYRREDGEPTAVCGCCQQVVREMVEVPPMYRNRFVYLCLACCQDIAEAAKDAEDGRD